MDEGEKKEVAPLFSTEDRRGIVKSFISAYLYGSITVNVPTRQTVKAFAEADPAYARDPANEAFFKIDHVKEFAGHVFVITGTHKASPSEIDASIDMMFGLIVAYRQGKMIEGKFLDEFNLEKRFSSLEDRIVGIEKLLEELRTLMRVRRD
jgi:hypothetical protein